MTPPNVIFMLVDDMGWRDLSCYGSPFYETPNLDRLCAQGLRFTDAYAACPVCSPTRASIMTGKYPARLGQTDWIGAGTRGKLLEAPYVDHLSLSEKSLASALHDGGYATWHVGKWHLGTAPYWPEHHGFEVNVGGCDMGCPSYGYFAPWHIPNLSESPVGTYLTDRLTDEVVRLIASRDGRPFFLNLCYYLVHHPLQAKPDLVAKYRAKAQALGLDQVRTFAEGEPFPCEHKKHLHVLRRLVQSDPVYAAMIETLDTSVGRILEALEASGQADNTLILFTSDNGGLATSEGSPTCNAPLAEGKGWMYEGGTREPLIAWWPGVVPAGGTCSVPVTSPDIYPTVLDMAGLPPLPEQHVDGVSLAPLLRGGKRLAREAIFWHYPHYGNQGGTPGCSVRLGDYKLIAFFEDGRLELYNLRQDIGEQHNLVHERPELAAELYERLLAWRQSVGALLPQPNPAFVPWY
jgi:arylsulfatase A-like enzyme